MYLDVCFKLQGDFIALNHNYQLWEALAEKFAFLKYDEGKTIGIDSINGKAMKSGNGNSKGLDTLEITSRSILRIRTPIQHINPLLEMADSQFKIDDDFLEIYNPHVYPLNPSWALWGRMVAYRGIMDPEGVKEAVEIELKNMGITSDIKMKIPTYEDSGAPKLSFLMIQDKKIVGFPLYIVELSNEDSVKIQTYGVGDFRHLGCGIFLPEAKKIS